ncbi:MAG: hypothetical protein KGS61_03880, partial [Verrucomicrobia bacterium]|nr:hypothetical protein [Verrucomicrobiota bacterium]
MALRRPVRWWGWLALLGLMALGLARLRFDAEVLDLLPGDLPVVHGLKLYQQHFSDTRQLIVTVHAGNADAAQAVAQRLAQRLGQATNLVEQVWWQPPWLEHPEQTAEVIADLWFNQPPAVFAELGRRLAPANLPRVLAATRDELATTLSPADLARLSYDPFGLTRLPDPVASAAPSFTRGEGMFASPDGRFRLLFVRARSDLAGYRACTRWLEQVRAVADACVPPAERTARKIVFGYTGRPAYVA